MLANRMRMAAGVAGAGAPPPEPVFLNGISGATNIPDAHGSTSYSVNIDVGAGGNVIVCLLLPFYVNASYSNTSPIVSASIGGVDAQVVQKYPIGTDILIAIILAKGVVPTGGMASLAIELDEVSTDSADGAYASYAVIGGTPTIAGSVSAGATGGSTATMSGVSIPDKSRAICMYCSNAWNYSLSWTNATGDIDSNMGKRFGVAIKSGPFAGTISCKSNSTGPNAAIVAPII